MAIRYHISNSKHPLRYLQRWFQCNLGIFSMISFSCNNTQSCYQCSWMHWGYTNRICFNKVNNLKAFFLENLAANFHRPTLCHNSSKFSLSRRHLVLYLAFFIISSKKLRLTSNNTSCIDVILAKESLISVYHDSHCIWSCVYIRRWDITSWM